VITVDIPITNAKKPPKLLFPDRCVNCGKRRMKTLPVKLSTGAQKRGQMIQVEFDVPLCADCLAKENKIGNVTWIPFFVVGLLTCILVFIPVWLATPEGPTLQTYEFPYVLGAFVGMIAGIAVGTLVEYILKISLSSSYGKLLRKRPLTIVSVLNDSENVIGLSIRFADQRRRLKMSFENDEIARAFMALNPQENG
jgi:hypothetical protein